LIYQVLDYSTRPSRVSFLDQSPWLAFLIFVHVFSSVGVCFAEVLPFFLYYDKLITEEQHASSKRDFETEQKMKRSNSGQLRLISYPIFYPNRKRRF
jgi:hypothetical protein